MKLLIGFLFSLSIACSMCSSLHRVSRQAVDDRFFGTGRQFPNLDDIFNNIQQNGVQGQQQNGAAPPTQAPAAGVTPSPARLRTCVQNCPTTQQYNPVCASDMIVYTNMAILECNIQCGANISFLKNGICTRPSRT